MTNVDFTEVYTKLKKNIAIVINVYSFNGRFIFCHLEAVRQLKIMKQRHLEAK